MQDRAFTLGPAIFSRLLEYFEVEGDIVQTHLSSPRSIAYLAALFQANYRVNDIIIFGAGQRIPEYNAYMSKLGINNIRMRSENFCQVSIQSHILEKVVGIFITPPNSYSAISDPIDLICSRGGDLSMLEVLTESEMSESGKERVAKILEEQRESLRLAMSRPQVQFILYGTHSMVETENADMVQITIDSVNRAAHARHVKIFKEKRRLEALAEQDGLNAEQLERMQGVPSKKKAKGKEEDHQKPAPESEPSSDESDSGSEILDTSNWPNVDDDYSQVKVPKTDIFESIEIPDMCLYQNKCMEDKSAGCFLSLVKRKKITRLDEKHLILMAEKRGLFGDTNPKKERARIQNRSAKREEHVTVQPVKIKRKKSEEIALLVSLVYRSKNLANFFFLKSKSNFTIFLLISLNYQIDRLSQHTHSSLIRYDNARKPSEDHKLILFFPRLCEYNYQHHKRQEEWANREVMQILIRCSLQNILNSQFTSLLTLIFF